LHMLVGGRRSWSAATAIQNETCGADPCDGPAAENGNGPYGLWAVYWGICASCGACWCWSAAPLAQDMVGGHWGGGAGKFEGAGIAVGWKGGGGGGGGGGI
jgi:hypothetical protein